MTRVVERAFARLSASSPMFLHVLMVLLSHDGVVGGIWMMEMEMEMGMEMFQRSSDGMWVSCCSTRSTAIVLRRELSLGDQSRSQP